MGKKKDRRPRHVKSPPSADKHPRLRETPSSNAEHPSWRLSQLDLGGPFGWDVASADVLREVRSFLAALESMTWNEILVAGKSQHHSIAMADLSTAAQERLEHLKLDDVDELLSLRLGGRKRIFGIRDRAVLALLWWDPEHGACPAPKKHT